jgi:ABC-type nitrate/sulfonate/bicarbonate transport system substrate-binding protein
MNRTLLFGVSVLLATSLLTGCNRQGGQPISQEPAIKIRLAYPAAGTLISGQVGLVMQKTDILKQNGLEAEIFPMATGKEMKTAMTAGKVDVILTSESNFVVLLGQGFECYGIASLGTDGQMGLVVSASSDIKHIPELKGGKIGTLFGTSVHKPAIEWARQGGLVPGKDVEIVNIGDGGALRAALSSGNVKAIVDWDPYLTDGINKGNYRVLASADLDLIVVTSGSYADKNPTAISRFRAALKEAAFYMSQNKKTVTQWYAELAKLDASFVDQVSQYNKNYNAKTRNDIDISISQKFVSKLTDLADFWNKEGLIEKKPDIASHIKQ